MTLWRVSQSGDYFTNGICHFIMTIFYTSDIRRLNSKAVFAKSTGMIILGGGLVKHHISNANLMVIIWTQKSTMMQTFSKKKKFSWVFSWLSEERSRFCGVCQHWAGVWRLWFRRPARWSCLLGKDPHGCLSCKGKIHMLACSSVTSAIFFLSYVACYKYRIHMMIWLTVLLCFCAGLCWCFYSLSTFSGWNFCTQRQQVDQGEEERLMVLFSCKTYLNTLPLISLFLCACFSVQMVWMLYLNS